MPEMPEVQGLVDYLAGRLPGLTVTRVTVANIAALKTYDPPLDALVGARVASVSRHGKFIDIEAESDAAASLHLIFHLAKAGWLRWYDQLPSTIIRPGKTPIALRVGFSDDSGFDLTEAGTKKSLAVYAARNPTDAPGIERLGPDPLDPGFDRDALAALLRGRRTQIKGVLRDQSIVAGIGNAYSDEILHAAQLSPMRQTHQLEADEIARLFEAVQQTLRTSSPQTGQASPRRPCTRIPRRLASLRSAGGLPDASAIASVRVCRIAANRVSMSASVRFAAKA